MQRRFLEAALGYWAEPANNPASSVYSGRMIATAETAAWTWDARPFPAFPARSDVWTDADNWRLGHWLNGRLGSVSLGSLVRELCRRAGLPDGQIDVSALADVVHGYLITALESPRASIAPLARHFGFDAVESEGVIRFQPRDRRPVATLGLDDLVAGSDADAEVIELVRAQETELPQALKWQLVRSDEEYDAMSVEARRATGAALRVTSETFAIATPAGDAERRCRRALLEEWVGRETASFRLPPSRLALDPGDVVRLDHDGRLAALRLTGVADAGARAIEAVRTDASAYGLAPGSDRSPRVSRPVVYGPPAVAILDLPQLRESTPAHQPLAAVHAVPWPGRIAAWTQPRRGRLHAGDHARPAGTDGAARRRRSIAGPTSRFDLGNVAVVDLAYGTLASVTDLALFAGANALAVEGEPGRLGGAAGRRRRADRAGPLPALAAAARPARHRGRHRQPGAGRRAGRRARRGAGAAAGRRGGARARGQLALRAGVEAGRRPVLSAARLHARGRGPAAVLGRPRPAAVANGARARRSR